MTCDDAPDMLASTAISTLTQARLEPHFSVQEYGEPFSDGVPQPLPNIPGWGFEMIITALVNL